MSTPGKKKIFFWVLLAHLGFLGILIISGLISGQDEYVSPVTAIEVVDPVQINPVEEIEMEEEESEPEEEIVVEEEIKEEIIEEEEKDEPEPRPKKKITKRINKYNRIESTDLKKRLQQRLKKIKSPSRPPAASSAITADNDHFPFSWYDEFIRSRILSLWQKPSRSTVGKDTATALVKFRVFRDGHIENIILKESSGSSIMDNSGLRATRMADPLPPLPEGFRGDHVDFAILFELKN